MIVKKTVMMIVATITTIIFAAPTVKDVTAKQRYPWNGLVDISCKVTGIDGMTNLWFAVAAVLLDSGNVRNAWNWWVVQDGVNLTDYQVHTNGTYRLLWDAGSDIAPEIYSNIIVRVALDAHNRVQLWEDGPYWATTNIGAEEPWEYGYYFWWGDIVGYKWENDAWVSSDGRIFNEFFTSYFLSGATNQKSWSTLQSEGWTVSKNGTYILAPEHDAAQMQWGGGWRMPTSQEIDDLNSKCSWMVGERNGVKGCIVSGKGIYVGNSIFLPLAGRAIFTPYDMGSEGYYWLADPIQIDKSNDVRRSWCLRITKHSALDFHVTYSSDRYEGFLIRPVLGGGK